MIVEDSSLLITAIYDLFNAHHPACYMFYLSLNCTDGKTKVYSYPRPYPASASVSRIPYPVSRIPYPVSRILMEGWIPFKQTMNGIFNRIFNIYGN